MMMNPMMGNPGQMTSVGGMSVGQPGMMPGMMQPGMMPGMMQPGMMPGMAQPVYKQISVGPGIDMKEFNTIVSATTQAYMTRAMPLSTVVAQYIKNMIGGEWFVFISQVGLPQDYDFSLTIVKGCDFMSFSLDNTLFQVCRAK